jgi:hypothetical protein
MIKANDKYSALLTAGYTVGQNTLYVTAVPDNVPTYVTAAKGTDNETVFSVTGKTANSLTGVTRVRGANVNLDAQTPLTCLNNEDFINQFHEAATGKATGEEIDTGTEDAKIVTPKAIADASVLAKLAGAQTFTGAKTFEAVSTFRKSTKQASKADTDGETITFDMDEANYHTVTLGGNRTLAVTNVSVGQSFMLRLQQDGTGSRTVTWFSTIKWAGGSAPTLTTTANKADVFGFTCTSSGNYDGFVVGQSL